MKRIVSALFALLWALPAAAQLPPSQGIVINQTPTQGSTAGYCLYVTSTGRVGNQACGAGTAANIQVGTTTITSGTTGRLLYDNAGVLGEFATTISSTTISFPGTVGVATTTPQSTLSVTGSSLAPGNTGVAEFTTGTGASTDEKLVFGINGTSYSWIQALKPGTGYRPLYLQPSGSGVSIGGATIGSNALAVTGTTTLSGNLLFSADATYDIGASGATRPRDINMSRNLLLANASQITFGARSQILSTADGNVLLMNSAGTGFTSLILGSAASASFPAWKRSGTNFHARLADDSDYTNVTANSFVVNSRFEGLNATRIGPTSDGYLTVTNQAVTSGFAIDLTTDATVKFRNRGNSSDANVYTGALNTSGYATFNTTVDAPFIKTGNSGSTKTVFSMTSAGSQYGTIQVEATGGTGAWSLGYQASPNATLGTAALTWTGSGNVTVAGTLTVNGTGGIDNSGGSGASFRNASTGYIYWANRANLYSPADGKLGIIKNSGGGGLIDATTNGTLAFYDTDGTTGATISAQNLTGPAGNLTIYSGTNSNLIVSASGSGALDLRQNNATMFHINGTRNRSQVPIMAAGSTPTNAGSCSATFAGGSFAGTFTLTAGCAAGTIIITMNAVTTGYACTAHNRTTPANAFNQTATSTTTATMTGTGNNGDVIGYSCIGY